MATVHRRLSASTFSRLAACSGSAALCDIAPPSMDSKYSREGTTVHYVAARLIHEATTDAATELIGTYCPETGQRIDQSHITSASMYVHECLNYISAADLWEVEKTLDGAWLHPDVGGTPDFFALTHDGALVVIDEKNGYEVADADLQLIVYAVLAIQYLTNVAPTKRIKSITLIVKQPNCEDPNARHVQRHYPDAAKFYTDAVAELQRIIADVKEKPLTRVPGKQCKYCDGAALCPENRQRVNEAAAKYFKLAEGVPKMLTPAEIGEELVFLESLKKLVSQRSKAVNLVGYHLVDKQAQEVPGYKLVESLGNREWLDELEVVKVLQIFGVQDDTMRQLKGPAYLETLAPKGLLDNFITRQKKGKKLVEAGSRGAPSMSSINQWFNQ